MYRPFSVVFAVCVTSALAAGQAASQSAGRVEVFGGFSWLSQDLSLSNPNGTGPIGWNASATFPVSPRVGVVVDVSGHYPSYNFGCGVFCVQSAKIHSFLFGPQISISRRRMQPFARFLIGDTYMTTDLSTFTSNNSFTFAAGGGIDIKLNHRLAWRGQVDWLHNFFHTSDNQRTSEEVHDLARLSTGIVIRF